MTKIEKYIKNNETCVFDVANALYHFLQHNWQGQTDPLYRDFCILTHPGMYKPGHSEEFFENISEESKIIYDMLTEKNYTDALNIVLNYESES